MSPAARALKPKARIAPDEIACRRERIRRAEHQNLLEGIKPNADVAHIYEAYINGEFGVNELVPRLKEFLAAKRA